MWTTRTGTSVPLGGGGEPPRPPSGTSGTAREAGPARSRLQASAARGLTRFVGPDDELSRLKRALPLTAEVTNYLPVMTCCRGISRSSFAITAKVPTRILELRGRQASSLGEWRLTAARAASDGPQEARGPSTTPVVRVTRCVLYARRRRTNRVAPRRGAGP